MARHHMRKYILVSGFIMYYKIDKIFYNIDKIL